MKLVEDIKNENKTKKIFAKINKEDWETHFTELYQKRNADTVIKDEFTDNRECQAEAPTN